MFFCCGTTRCLLYTDELRSATTKDELPDLQRSNLIYPFSSLCRYVGRTYQRLQDRIKQHAPKSYLLLLFFRNAYFLPVSANLKSSLISTSLLFFVHSPDFIFYKILPVFNIMMTEDSLFSIYLPLKPLSSKRLSPLSADKKNPRTALNCAPMPLSCWSFWSQSRLGFFLYIATAFHTLSILRFLASV